LGGAIRPELLNADLVFSPNMETARSKSIWKGGPSSFSVTFNQSPPFHHTRPEKNKKAFSFFRHLQNHTSTSPQK